ncbi:MFS transporter [Rubinisphaera margarita]|uniref:MFS transporter n=1 Tax=Rubinisphaera margarita TaxID=2909586 RepID=UPI001EE8415C|nr:MFS transporter [Rubinisphaera margarita]MCG6157167.1 MFS transporter [Rubinisphaera margarita]
MNTNETQVIAPNAYRLLWAGFTAILAAGVGFAIRGGILNNWRDEFGFSFTELGAIGGAGLTGFCFGIFIGGVVVDKIGYGKLVIAAFVFHIASALVALMPGTGMDKATVFAYLYWGTFLFAVANGTLEAVANPLVATLFPTKRTHFLNILHASWPAGLVLGSALGWVLDDMYNISWKYQLALFLIPTVVYGLMFLGQSFPRSEASEKGLSFGEMFRDVGILGGAVACFLLSLFFAGVFGSFNLSDDVARNLGYGIGGILLIAVAVITRFSIGSWLLFVLFVTHALVGAVELGTDGWIQNIIGNILTSGEGKILFVYTSMIMFLLRFCADFIERKIGLSPIGILLVCSILGCVGLNLASGIQSFEGALLALGVYAVGKTFFWPTMLAVVSDRFPRTGAIAISVMGGIGMMSAGLIGSAGLGYSKDHYAAEALQESHPEIYEKLKAEEPSKFLTLQTYGIDGDKVKDYAKIPPEERSESDKELLEAVAEAGITGDRKTLVADSFIPATMAVIYLCLFFYFKAIGGYKTVHLAGTQAEEIDENDEVIPAHEK